jgi:ubiquinone/menaquinone biosynthesis C-methylase UbiE
MKIKRDKTNKIRNVLDNWIPRPIRDSRVFMWVPFKLLFGKKSSLFFDFKQKSKTMSKEEFQKANRDSLDALIERQTDLNEKCIEKIIEDIDGNEVLEVGCGRGYLANLLAGKGFKVTGVDLSIDHIRRNNFNIVYLQGDIEELPFLNNQYDTVVCTHTLEHVQNFEKALAELRRVAKKRLIIVVPKQKEFKYTFDLHLHFFPTLDAFTKRIDAKGKYECVELDGDIYYKEDL